MSRQINIGNIGWYLLQAHEGSLNAQEMDALCAFLEEHPELVPETEPILVESNDTEVNNTFTYLKKDDYELSAFDTLAVSVLEGERNENELSDITAKRADLQVQWQAFQHSVLKSVMVSFPGKSKLYKQRVQVLWMRYAAAACVVALVAGWVWNNFGTRSRDTQQLVNNSQMPADKNPAPIQIDSLPATESIQIPSQNPATYESLPRNNSASKQKSTNYVQQTQLAELERITIQHQPFLSSPLANQTHLEINNELLQVSAPENLAATEPGEGSKRMAGIIRNVFSRGKKSTSADWFDVLASAGNQSLEQISKGRIEFSHQPENEKGPDTYLKIGNFSITRSLASN